MEEISIKHKKCTKCKQTLDVNLFCINNSAKDGYNFRCKSCINNDPEVRKSSKESYLKHRDKTLTKNRIYEKTEEYKTKRRERENTKWKENPQYRIRKILRNRIYKLFKTTRTRKSYKNIEYLDCSIEYYKQFLEKQFYPEMNWSNHGKIWEIDHIKPCSEFDLTIEKEQFKCFNYLNTIPLFKTTAIAKSFGYKDIIGNRDKRNTII